jgi:hypothetical protein
MGREALFTYMADFSHSERWDPSVVHAARLSEGAVGLGARFLVEVGVLGRRLPFEYEVTAFESPTRVQLSARHKAMISIDTMTFVERDGGSTLAYDAEVRLVGPYRLLAPLLGLGFRRVGERARAGLLRELNQ